MNLPIDKILAVIKDPDLKLKINELYGENLSLKEKNYNLKQKLEKLRDISEIDFKLLHEDNHYFLMKDDVKDGPYCTKCWDADKKLLRLHKDNLSEGLQHYTCPNCKTHTNTGNYIPSHDNITPINYGI